MSGTLSLAVALHLARTCAGGVAPETLLSVVKTESGLNAYAVGDNTDRRSYSPATRADAVALTDRLVAAGHSIDMGAAQINSAAGHMQRRGLPLSAAFDPCIGFRVGGEVLADCWKRATGVSPQARLLSTIGCYNAGHPSPGTAYVLHVQASAAQIVPAIQIAGPYRAPATPEDTVAPEPPRPPPGMEDALHVGSPVPDLPTTGLVDAYHRPSSPTKEPTQ